MTKALRGINLGGWLVAERWMTPSLFEGVRNDGEIALVQELGYEEARRRLQKHRDSFITEDDFIWIASHGFDFIRLPVGYWLFAETDDFIDGELYVRRAFEWANIHGIGVVLDFHGLQGSQNGLDHSGQVGKVRLYRRRNRSQALETLAYMCQTYGSHERLIAVELINEPKVRWFLWRLMGYYDRAIAIAERSLRPDVKIIVSDAFKPLRLARAISRRGYGSRVVLDMHLYRMFDGDHLAMSHQEHVAEVGDDWHSTLVEVSKLMPVMVGEWSAALPTAAYRTAGNEREAECIQYFLAQQQVFDETTWAHSYWSYKVLGGGVWDYKKISQLLKKHSIS